MPYKDPEQQKAYEIARQAKRATPEYRALRRAQVAEKKKDPAYAAKIKDRDRKKYLLYSQDPEWLAKQSVLATVRYHKNAVNPEFLAKNNAKAKEYFHKVKNDPVFKAKAKLRKQIWGKENAAYISLKNRKKYELNKPEILAKSVAYKRVRRQTNEDVRLGDNVARNFNRSLKTGSEGRAWPFKFRLEHLINHLKSLFEDEMNWDNYGEWEIDHVIPRCQFGHGSPKHPLFHTCWSLKNLQPLWKADHMKKGSKLVY